MLYHSQGVCKYVFECVSEVEKGKVGIFALECRLSEGASLGRERSRLSENAQDFELASGGFSLGRECLAWARMPRLGESSHAWARMAQAMPRKESRKPRNESTDRKRLGRGPSRMDRNSTHIRGYHFTMSPEGQWNSDGYRYTYSGLCGLKVHMECAGSSMMIPHPDAVSDASFTLPLRRNPIPGVGVSFPPVQSDVAGPSSGCRTWPDVVDAPSSSRAFRSDGRGAGSCKKSPELRLSSPPNYASGIWHHDMELDDEEEDEVIELVEVESSVEVINLVSDSEEEEDPSEGSSIPGIF
ncbi:unnamed protein product [Lupinus luteus]|uniref:Uncharacterized protein n=1 Tax=Lupinus luteus TaxID=3873 RepID=A0AAV1X646_LUPLU